MKPIANPELNLELSPKLSVENASIAYGKNTVVKDVSFQLSKGEIGCLLGPSGCGKTTLLRSIAGFEPLARGAIHLNGHQIGGINFDLPPEKRNIGMVFQDFALFPHLNVTDNIAFGLRHLKRSERQPRIQQLLKLIALQGFESRYPHELSGGQQQRIALARALAPKPDLLLLDEPFSSMDVELREDLAREVRHILNTENITAILVTHDQNEAFVVADTIGVMKNGKLLQWSDDYTLYHQPATPFVADFIGKGAFIDGEVINGSKIQTVFADLPIPADKIPASCQVGDKVRLFIRPDAISLNDKHSLKATVLSRKFQGDKYFYTLSLGDNSDQNTALAFSSTQHPYSVNEVVGLKLQLEHSLVFTS